ncbi:hypothetical protein Droror1_Dr00025609 [Drosera rotundifolia]
MVPEGADAYIDELASVIPITNGSVRTTLDTGCGVASWGAYLLKRNGLAMSCAPRDNHEAQVRFALERGVPAVISVLLSGDQIDRSKSNETIENIKWPCKMQTIQSEILFNEGNK